jgi:hypothetical protein
MPHRKRKPWRLRLKPKLLLSAREMPIIREIPSLDIE